MLDSREEVLLRLQSGTISGIEALSELLELEKNHRGQPATQSRIARSKIRKGAALEEFDFTFKRSTAKADL